MTASESSRSNGAKSRGPKTPRGRAASSGNAVTHGITAKTLILQNENSQDFLAMLDSYLDYLCPSNQVEADLVSDLVAARWRLRRIWRYETALLDIEMDAQAAGFEKRFLTRDEDMRGSLAWDACVENRPGFKTALRYEVPLGRVYRRTLDQLAKIAKRTWEVDEN